MRSEYELDDIKKDLNEAAQWACLVDFMLTETDFDFARPFLKSVQLQYRDKGFITEAQINGVRRVYEAGNA